MTCEPYGLTKQPAPPWRPGSPDCAWNTPVDRAKLDRNHPVAARMRSAWGLASFDVACLHGSLGDGGYPVVWAKPTDPLRSIAIGAGGKVVKVRIPNGTQVQGGGRGDAHLTVISQVDGMVREFWTLQVDIFTPDVTHAVAGTYGECRIDGDGTGVDTNASQTAVSFGLVRPEELVRASAWGVWTILHALALRVPYVRDDVGIYPSIPSSGFLTDGRPDSPRMGQRLALDMTRAEVAALMSVPPWGKGLLDAFAEYGGIVTDTTGGFAWGTFAIGSSRGRDVDVQRQWAAEAHAADPGFVTHWRDPDYATAPPWTRYDVYTLMLAKVFGPVLDRLAVVTP